MKNLHNWALISEDAALLGAAKNDELPNVIHRLRKYREEGETIEACLPVFAAIIALSAAFPEILKVSFKSQAMKSEWALFCKTRGWSDLSGRVQKPMKIVSMESGNLVDVETNMRLDPPARQAWLPWVGLADDVLQALMHAYTKTPRETEKKPHRWLQQSETDIAETYWLEQKFSFGGAMYVVDGKARLRPGTVQDMAQDTFEFEGVSFNKSVSLYLADKAIRREAKNKPCRNPTHDDHLDAAALLAPRRIACPEELAMGYGASEKTAKELGEQLREKWANGVGSGIKKCWDESQQLHKEQTMNLTQKASAFFGNLKSVGLDLLRVQRGRATLHSAKRVIFAALPIKWGFLARLTGKAKKVENHPLTDLGLALALHGATNFAISDPVKREKYLKYTEEMLVAAGYSVSLKMLPVEDMLDKIFAGVGESEAMSKLKELVKDSGEPEIKVTVKQ